MKKGRKIFLLAILTICFFVIGSLVSNHNQSIIDFDVSIKSFLSQYHSPAINSAMISVTKICDPIGVSIFFLISSLILILKKKKGSFRIFTLATILGAVLPYFLKIFFARVRPVGGLILETDPSFPSGHATISTVFIISAILLFAPLIKNIILKKGFALLAVITFSLVAFSRIFLSVHWTTDIIAGILLGSICYILADLSCCHLKKKML